VLEPYDRTPFIGRVRRLEVLEAAPGTNPVAVEVTLADGRVDTLISCETPGRVQIEGGIGLDGAHGFVSRRAGVVECAKLMEGTSLSCGIFQLTAAAAAYTGTVVRVLAEDPNDQQLELSASIPEVAALAGRTLFVRNDGVQDAAYTLVGPPRDRRVSLGAITLVRGYVDPSDPAKGYRLNVAPGDAYRVPAFAYLDTVTGAAAGNVVTAPAAER
jgi:hypothetical protein